MTDQLVEVIVEAIACHCPAPYDLCPHDDPRPEAKASADAVRAHFASVLDAEEAKLPPARGITRARQVLSNLRATFGITK